MTIATATRLDSIKPSITLAISAQALDLKNKGVDIVSFSAGEPDFDTPEHIKQAARVSLDHGASKYTNVRGLPELREAVANELGGIHSMTFGIDQILVSTGAKQSLFNLFMATLNPGDEVIIAAPYWVSYPDMVKIAGGSPVVVKAQASDGFMLRPLDLEAACTGKTRFLLLNNPSNPTGGLYTKERLQQLAEVCLRKDIAVISDDIYRHLVYGDAKYVSIGDVSPELAQRSIFVDGVSKAYAMTGWRIGYAAGPANVIAAMTKIQSQSTSNAAHISQRAALEAITGPQDCLETMRTAFDERRKRMVKLLCAIPGVTCPEPKGAFYAFPDVSAYIGKKTKTGAPLADDVALASFLVEDANVAVVPGSGFGAPGFIRLSYACSMDLIDKGVGRISEALSALQ